MLLSNSVVPTDQEGGKAKVYHKTAEPQSYQQGSLQGTISPSQKHGADARKAGPEEATYLVPLN